MSEKIVIELALEDYKQLVNEAKHCVELAKDDQFAGAQALADMVLSSVIQGVQRPKVSPGDIFLDADNIGWVVQTDLKLSLVHAYNGGVWPSWLTTAINKGGLTTLGVDSITDVPLHKPALPWTFLHRVMP